MVLGASVLLLRLAVRARTVGIRQFDGDDYISIVVLLCYIGDAVTVDLTYHLGSNVDFTKAQFEAMSPAELDEVVTGSRLQLLAWYSYTALIWTLKACMLFFFGRLTSGLRMQTYVRYMSAVIVLSYIAVFITISTGCFPIQKNWQVVPDPGSKCTVSCLCQSKDDSLYQIEDADLRIVEASESLCNVGPECHHRRSNFDYTNPGALES